MANDMKAGARHSAGDMQHIQEIHDRALALGATPKADAQKDGVWVSIPVADVKSVDLDEWTARVRGAFYDLFPSSPMEPTEAWVEKVFDDSVIVCVGQDKYRAAYTMGEDSVTFAPFMEWEKGEMTFTTVKALSPDTLIAYGGDIKALGDGKVGGYLVRFSSADDPDLENEFFTKETDFGEATKLPVLYHHGLDSKMGRRRIGTGQVRKDEIGLWIEAQLNLRDEYEKAIYALAEKGKQGWSSGAAGHTVVRERAGKATRITQWYIAEASTTPTPAEPRNGVMSLKTLKALEIELPEANAEGQMPANAADSAQVKTAPTTAQDSLPANTAGLSTKNVDTSEVNEMTPEQMEALLNQVKTTAAQAAGDAVTAFAAAQAETIKTTVMDALKAAPLVTPPAGVKTNPGNGLHKTPLGDDAFKAFNWFLKTGDPSGIRTGEAYEDMLDDRSMKTTYHLLESTQYQGQEAVPTEVVARIIEKRDPLSVVRAGGAQVIPVGSNAVVLPIEKASPENFVITTVDGTNTFDQTTVQPIDKLAATVYLFTRSVPIDMQLLDDAVIGIEAWWSRRIARAWALTENAYFLMGTGSGQPGGAVYGGTTGVTAAAAAAVTAGEIVSLYHKLAAEYRDNVSWVMRGATEGTVRALTASTTFPFVGNGGNQGGVGNSGFPQGAGWLVDPRSKVFNSDGMDALAASKKPIAVANFEAGYAIFERKGLTVFRDPYSLAAKGEVNILAYFREAGGITNALAIQNLVTPSA